MLAFFIFLNLVLVYMLMAVWAERKISAFIQDRYGPTEVGFWGIGQTIPDLLKLLQKEDIVPENADKYLFKAAPFVIFTAVFAGFAVMPLGPDLVGSGIKSGVFYLLTVISLDVVGLLMAGWGSNNKYSLFGALRGIAQLISYEIPLSLSVLAVVIICQTLDLQEINYQQGIWINKYGDNQDEINYLFGIKALGVDITNTGGFLTWNIFRAPVLLIAFIIFFISSLAECNRAPFDIPEAESELVAGFHTEYSGFRWALLFLSEYSMMLLVSLLAAVLFFGGWNTPLPNIGNMRLADWTGGTPGTIAGNVIGFLWLLLKVILMIFLQMMARWTYPRLRVDQLMFLGWKVLTPAALIVIFIAAICKLGMI